jgi:UDP-N-acetyl-D-mannosaminuronic acid dehydrogenase
MITEKNKQTVAVVGLGYVGLTLATTLAEIGYNVFGIEKRKDVVNLTNKGVPHFHEPGLGTILKKVIENGNLKVLNSFNSSISAEIYIITVGTPLDNNGKIRLDFLENATKEVAANMKDGALVMLRSTVKVGTTRNIVKPILQKNTTKQFHIAMCPERTLEGCAMQELRHLPQVIGCDDKLTRQKAYQFFERITNSVIQLSSLEAAEILKLVDNTYRDVQFGFANEVARICGAYKVNTNEIIVAGKQSYERTNVALPGLVGGPCLEKDTHIFVQSAMEKGISLEISNATRLVNERQPQETVTQIVSLLQKKKSCKIIIWGIAFKGKPDTNDLRGSMSLKIIEQLERQLPSAKLSVYDPVCSLKDLSVLPNITVIENQLESIQNMDCLIIANNHPQLSKIDFIEIIESLNRNGFVYDYWNHFSTQQLGDLNSKYFSL